MYSDEKLLVSGFRVWGLDYEPLRPKMKAKTALAPWFILDIYMYIHMYIYIYTYIYIYKHTNMMPKTHLVDGFRQCEAQVVLSGWGEASGLRFRA